MLKLITCDIDGTLLKKYHDPIDEKLFKLIEDFYKKDVLFFATSGRQLYNLQQIFEPVKEKIGYIAENGALIVHNGKTIYKSAMDMDLVKELSNKILKKDNLELFICAKNTTYVIPKAKDFEKTVASQVVNHITPIKSLDDIKDDVLKVSLFNLNGINDDIISYFEKDFGHKLQHTVSGHSWYDFMNLNTHKGSAIKFLQQKINVSPQQTAAFGDNFNDIEMLLDAKYSYAMEDAHQQVKNVAKYTCTDVTQTLQQLYNKFFG